MSIPYFLHSRDFSPFLFRLFPPSLALFSWTSPNCSRLCSTGKFKKDTRTRRRRNHSSIPRVELQFELGWPRNHGPSTPSLIPILSHLLERLPGSLIRRTSFTGASQTCDSIQSRSFPVAASVPRTVTWRSEYRSVDITNSALPSWPRIDGDPHNDH